MHCLLQIRLQKPALRIQNELHVNGAHDAGRWYSEVAKYWQRISSILVTGRPINYPLFDKLQNFA